MFVPAFNGLFAPRWRSDARGVIVGLSGNTGRAHIVRAALEAVAFQSKELLDAMEADRAAAHVAGGAAGGGEGAAASSSSRGGTGAALCVDGGMTVNNLLMQFQADIIGKPVVKPVVAETTALGAAYAAGLAVGFWGGLDELRSQWQVERTWQPGVGLTPDAAKGLVAKWERAVARSLDLADN